MSIFSQPNASTSSVIILSFLVFIMSLPVHAAREVSQLHLKPGDGNWSIGVGYRGGTVPYIGEDKEDDVLPLIIYNGDTFFIDGSRVGFHLYQSPQWFASSYVSYRFGGFNEEDSAALVGMDRNDGMDGRFALTRLTQYGNFTVDIGADISNNSQGWDSEISWGKRFEYGNFYMRPWLSLTYENDELTNYYFGVTEQEALINRPAYKVKSAVEWHYGIDMSYQIAQHHFVGLNMQYSQLKSTKIDSPIVVDKGKFSTFLSYRYEFNDYQYELDHSSSLTKGLTQGEWYWRVAAGRHTDTTFNKLLRFQDMFKPEERGTGLVSVFVGKKLGDSFFSLPLDVYVTGGIARRLENDLQDDFNEYALGFKVYFSKFPWSDKIKTRVGIAQGVSYAAKVPFVEKEHVEGKNRSASKFLNYLDFSWDVSVGDVFNVPKLKECYFGWSVHHRSGIFASADIYGNVDGGSNVNTLYLQCHNNV